MNKIDVSQTPVEIIEARAPDPPGADEIAGEIERLEWLLRHPYVSDDFRAYVTMALGALTWAQQGAVEQPSVVLQRSLVEALDDGQADECGVRYCLSCGCTDGYACPGGCGWSNAPGICTVCATKGGHGEISNPLP